MLTQQERRRSERKKLNQLTYIELPSSNGGIVTDLSEEGLRFYAVLPVDTAGPIHFWFSGGSRRIAAVGDLVWIDESKKGGGLRFVEIPDEAREQIRKWPLESHLRPGVDGKRDSAQAPKPEYKPEYRSLPALPANKQQVGSVSPRSYVETRIMRRWLHGYPRSFAATAARSIRSWRRSPGWATVIGISCLAGVIGFMSNTWYHEVSGRRLSLSNRIPEEQTPPSQVSKQPPEFALLSNAPAATTEAEHSLEQGVKEHAPEISRAEQINPPGARTTADNELLFVQVATYMQEADAHKLVERLRQEHFVAFVSLPANETLYHVQLGPYLTEEAAEGAQSDLRKAGFNPIIQR